jgi:hypothetical protein
MSWKQQKMISFAAIVAALVVNCLPADNARPPAGARIAVAAAAP